jgi:DtxR family Mn-dependent transcriptional regulator
MEKRIATALGNPDRDPHGEPIPSADLIMPRDPSIPLSELIAGQEARVRRAEASDSEALRRLDAAGVRIGSVVKVMSRSEYDRLLTLQIRGQPKPVTLGPALTERVFVERTKTTEKESKETK